MGAGDAEEIERRLRRYAEEALRDFAKLPYGRWRRVKGDIFWDETIGDDEVQLNAEMTQSDEEAFRLAVTATMKNAECVLAMQKEHPEMFHYDRFGGDYRERPAPSVTISERIERCGELKETEGAGKSRVDPKKISARLTRYAEDALLDLVGCLPQTRLGRLQGEMTWQEHIDDDEMLFHLMTLEFTETYLHLTTEACLENAPMEMIRWSGDYPSPGSYGELPSGHASDIVPRTRD